MYLVSLHGQATSAWPCSSGMPTECRAGTKSASSSSMRRSTWVPMRAITRIETMTYAESVISTPNIGCSASRWPITNGMTYIVRPRMQPAYSPRMRSFISFGVHPVVGGTRVLLVDRADVGAVLDAGHVDRVGGGVEGVRLLRLVELGEGAGGEQRVGQLGPLLVGAGAPVDPVGLGQLSDLVDPGEDPRVGGRCLGVGGHAWIFPSRAFAVASPRRRRRFRPSSASTDVSWSVRGVARLRCRRTCCKVVRLRVWDSDGVARMSRGYRRQGMGHIGSFNDDSDYSERCPGVASRSTRSQAHAS